jgi:hypothetical protein
MKLMTIITSTILTISATASMPKSFANSSPLLRKPAKVEPQHPNETLCLLARGDPGRIPILGFRGSPNFSGSNIIMIGQTIGIALPGVFGTTAAEVGILVGQSIRNDDLSFEADSKSSTLVINDTRTKRVWTADLAHCVSDAVVTKWGPLDQPKFGAFSMTDVARLDDRQVKISVKEARTGKTCSMIVTLDRPNVSSEVPTDNMDAPFTALGLPPMFNYMKAG